MQHCLPRWRPFAVTLAICIGSLFGPCIPAAHADPSDRKPNAPLNVHGTIDGAKKLAIKLYSLYDRLGPLELEAIQKKNTPEKLPGKKLMAATGQLWKAMRDAKHLKAMGEPAGYDIERKLIGMYGNINHYAMIYANTREGIKLKVKIIKKRTKGLPKLKKVIAKAKQLLGRNQLDSIGKLMEKEGIALMADLSLFHPKEKRRYTLDFFGVLGSADGLLLIERGHKYLRVAEGAVTTQLKISNNFQSKFRQDQDESTQIPSGSVTKSMDRLLAGWGEASAALIRAHAISTAIHPRLYAENSAPNSPQRGKVHAKVANAKKQLTTQAVRAIHALIQEASQSASTDNIPQVYSEFLKGISVAQRRMGMNSKDLFDACQQPLSHLVSKSAGLDNRVAAYERATKEPLRWRRLYAKSHSLRLAEKYPLAHRLMASTTEVAAKNPGGRSTKSIIAPAYLGRWANQIMEDAAPRLIEQSVSNGPSLQLVPTLPRAVIPFNSAHYVNVVLSVSTKEAIADLRSAIMITDTHGPLTMNTADAVSSAERSDFQAVGGVVRRIYLEARLVRFAALPAKAYLLTPLESFPPLYDDRHLPHDAICWRLDIQQTWAHHKYFTAQANHN